MVITLRLCYRPPVHTASTGLPDAQWDPEVLNRGGHFLQTTPWLRVQLARGMEVLWQRGTGWRWAGAVEHSRGVRYLSCSYGPSVDSPDRVAPALNSIRAAARAHGLDFARVEPDVPAYSARVNRRRTLGGQPRHTLLLDLRRGEADLRGDLTSGRRRSINTAEKKGIRVRRSRNPDDVEIFIDMIHRTADRNRFHPHPDTYYRTVCSVLFPLETASLYVAEAEEAAVAAVIGFESPTTAYYTYAAADAERSRKIVAAAPLAWRMVCDAMAEGRSTFDFWGVIPNESGDHPWAGLSTFKKTFGGSLLSRVGTFDLPVRRFRYHLYDTARRLRHRSAGAP